MSEIKPAHVMKLLGKTYKYNLPSRRYFHAGFVGVWGLLIVGLCLGSYRLIAADDTTSSGYFIAFGVAVLICLRIQIKSTARWLRLFQVF